jgi:hypothetical protein
MYEEVTTVEGRRHDPHEHLMRSRRAHGDVVDQAEVITLRTFVELILALTYGNLHMPDYRRGSS